MGDTKRSDYSPLLTPLGSGFMTEEDYRVQYWPQLEGAVQMLLTQEPGVYMKISYEQMYSCVYKCVCQQFAERMYSDLCNTITLHLQHRAVQLQNSSECQVLEQFHHIVKQYTQALGGIVPIFNYMNRFYIVPRIKSELRVELSKLFIQYIVDIHIARVLALLEEAQTKPFAVHPKVASEITNSLYSFSQDYAQLNPALFAKYIPNILPPTRLEDIPVYIQETQRLQQELTGCQEFNRLGHIRKRTNEDELINR
ncbi:CDK2-associated and cullin domain-containing protein 1 [Strongylocentrotus purpuratus]|uniref:Cullin N-terminal domain-containing protein n=1 Tax=Strongylocentrotus purpuratus TaxID=7668 RepID=A0A7M7REE6_STRPU|nr:CDK2-associated and cullin domain-containing protein 1 [Strongylocentrotus purpuratus]|eukprot:XP_780853.3 PREDICTED: CDK2-associated and cullin domain-containing protein 1 [Strongylocentrotus purpuratus]